MRQSLLIIVLLCAFSVSACSESSTVNGSTDKQITAAFSLPSPSPTSTPEVVDNDIEAAVNEFINKNYSGWTPQGIIQDCFVFDEPCEFHLTSGKNEKVIIVFAKKFQKKNGHFYWLVYEATKPDLAKAKINKIKEQSRQEALDNLSRDECSEICTN